VLRQPAAHRDRAGARYSAEAIAARRTDGRDEPGRDIGAGRSDPKPKPPGSHDPAHRAQARCRRNAGGPGHRPRPRREDRRRTTGFDLLEVKTVDTHYGDLHVLKSVDYRIAAGEIVCLLGGNASGKSTTMKAIMGSVSPSRGQILYDGHSLRGVSTAERVRRG